MGQQADTGLPGGTEIPAQQEGMLGKSHQSPAWQLEVIAALQHN